MPGTQEDLVWRAAGEYKSAKKYADECGRAQVGTTLGNDLSSARSKLRDAEGKFESAYGSYRTHMTDNRQTPKPRSVFV